MSEFISTLDILEGSSYDSQREIRDAVAEMDFQLRRLMDSGLSPEDMKKAQAGREAAQTASIILEKLFN
jgi:hypothetical protein